MVVKLDKEIETILIEENLVSSEELAIAQDLQKKSGKLLLQVITESGLVSEEAITVLIAKRNGLSFLDLGNYRINASAVSLISEDLARRYNVLPIDFEDHKLVVAMNDPSNIFALDDLKIVTGYEIKPVMVMESDLKSAINHYFKVDVSVDESLGDENADDIALSELKEITEDAPIVKLVNMIINKAVQDKASDIHIEPQEKDLRVRFRIDGVLHEIMQSPKRIQPAVLSRFKIMAGMDIAEQRKPQDGHCSLVVKGRQIDFRVATLPTVYGERIVLRILEKESIMLNLDDLGFSGDSLERYRSSFTKPYGAILITGPTGSGKSTSLYATLNVLNTESKNIVTIEDPVEYRLPGINQIQINPKAGLTFAMGLRAVLRSSPDILMVGEIRDKETAQIAVEAALTGHLVFSTLHTNDAPGAITRLTEMGIEPFLTSSAVDCIQAQRLARKLCKHCKEPYTPSEKSLMDIGFPLPHQKVPTLYKARGCPRCSDTGYKGRVGVYEVMLISEAIEQLTVERATAVDIRKIAISEGMRTLRDDGFQKVLEGVTSIEEIMRVIV
jgi:type IV pilus assembly protein PilB